MGNGSYSGQTELQRFSQSVSPIAPVPHQLIGGRMRALFISNNLVGDSLYVGPALRQYYQEHPDAEIHIQTLPNFAASMYSRMGVPVTVHTEEVSRDDFDFVHTFDCNRAFQVSHEKKCHIAESYADLLGVKIVPEITPEMMKNVDQTKPWYKPWVKPIFIPTEEEISENEKGLILVSAYSNSCTSQQGQRPNKMLPWPKWKVILRLLRTYGYPIRFIGGMKERIPLEISEDEYLLGTSLNRTALIMQQAKLLMTVDNGMSHLAASQELSTVLTYPSCLGLHYILPIGNRNLMYVQCDPYTVDTARLVAVMRDWLNYYFKLVRQKENRSEL